jgi:hypothetical protein
MHPATCVRPTLCLTFLLAGIYKEKHHKYYSCLHKACTQGSK